MPYDKKWHLILSAAICLLLGALLPVWTAAGITLTLGVGKEIVYDKWMGRGTPEWADFIADIVGTVIGCGGAICIKYLIQ